MARYVKIPIWKHVDDLKSVDKAKHHLSTTSHKRVYHDDGYNCRLDANVNCSFSFLCSIY